MLLNMDIRDKGANYNLDNMLQKMIACTSTDEGKLIITKDGIVTFVNVDNLSLNVNKDDNFFDFLSLHGIDYDQKLKDLNENSSAIDLKFTHQKQQEYFRVLIWPITYDIHSSFMVQLFCITESKQTAQRLANRRKSVENELLLRTREIMLTKEAMSQDGGFLTNFLRGLRHDLLSPITQLKEIIAFYQKTTDPVKQQKARDLTEQSLEKLSNTAHGFSQFVDLHFVHHGQNQQINLKNIIEQACEVLQAEITDAEASLSINFNHNNALFFNPKILQSIMYNLLSNAIKFRSEKRALLIDVTSYDIEDHIALEIKDNGIGIDLDRQSDKLFKPFNRLTSDKKGAGIGLSLVYNILNKNKGSIEIESELDHYTKVIVSFPRNKEG